MNITCSLIRKTLATTIRETAMFTREDHTALAQFMDHRVDTADEHYNIGNIRQVSLRVATLIHTMLGTTPDEEDTDVEGDVVGADASTLFEDEPQVELKRFGKPIVWDKDNTEQLMAACQGYIDGKVKDPKFSGSSLLEKFSESQIIEKVRMTIRIRRKPKK